MWDEFLNSMTKGRKRDAAQGKKSVEQIKEEKRAKLLEKAAAQGQSGATAFSKGGVSGPNKLEGLVAFGALQPGKDALVVKYEGVKQTGSFEADRAAGGNGRFVFAGKSFGDICTFTNAMLAAGGVAKRCKTNAECWKLVTSSACGKTMQQLKAQAAAAAKLHRVNPRSFKDCNALNPTPYTLHSEPSCLNHLTVTLNPEPEPLNPEPEAPNPEPSTRNPEPETTGPSRNGRLWATAI